MLPGQALGGTLGRVPDRLTFHDFLRQHEDATAESLSARYPAGCLLTRANITESNQDVTEVLALLPSAPGQPVLVGRGMDVDVVVPSGKVSKRHAEFQLAESGALVLTDLGSSNGTFVNGQLLAPNQPTRIEPGTTEVWFGDRQFFHFDGPALNSYVRHLRPMLANVEPPPLLPPASADSRPASSHVRPNPGDTTHVMHRDELEQQRASDPSVDERWTAALKALRELIKNAERIQLKLALQADPVTIYDVADPEADAETVLDTLGGLRSMVIAVSVFFKRSGFELTVFDREAQVP